MQFDIRRLDIYRKVPKDLTQPTFTGACISVCCMLFIGYLFVSELSDFISTDISSELLVADPSGEASRIPVILNITLPRLDFVGLDIQDDLGRHEVGFKEDTHKEILRNGDGVLGCRFNSKFFINKVPGNFHVSTHAAGQNQPESPDMRHMIDRLAFGEHDLHRRLLEAVPGGAAFTPLVQHDKRAGNPLATHDYIIRIVPVEVVDRWEQQSHPYQYTFAHREYLQKHGMRVVPAIWFRFDLTPISVRYTERRKPFYSFLTTVCAIIGGSFTVAGLIDSMVFSASEFYRKFQLGKLT